MEKFSYHKDGRRFIIDGDTRVAPKGELGKLGLGLKFDWDAKIWWTGKEDLAKEAVARLEGWAAATASKIATSATYAKLPDGSWGVRVPSTSMPTEGAKVAVSKASGETKEETLGALVTIEGDHHIFHVVRAKKEKKAVHSDGRSFRGGDRDYNTALKNYRETGDYYSSGLYDEES